MLFPRNNHCEHFQQPNHVIPFNFHDQRTLLHWGFTFIIIGLINASLFIIMWLFAFVVSISTPCKPRIWCFRAQRSCVTVLWRPLQRAEPGVRTSRSSADNRGFIAERCSHGCRWTAGAVCRNPHSLGNADTFLLRNLMVWQWFTNVNLSNRPRDKESGLASHKDPSCEEWPDLFCFHVMPASWNLQYVSGKPAPLHSFRGGLNRAACCYPKTIVRKWSFSWFCLE